YLNLGNEAVPSKNALGERNSQVEGNDHRRLGNHQGKITSQRVLLAGFAWGNHARSNGGNRSRKGPGSQSYLERDRLPNAQRWREVRRHKQHRLDSTTWPRAGLPILRNEARSGSIGWYLNLPGKKGRSQQKPEKNPEEEENRRRNRTGQDVSFS